MARPLRLSSPLHESVREEILNRINSGAYERGAPIPSATALGEEFGVSPITVKRALHDLKTAGALTSVPGKGTFVKENRRFIRDLNAWMSSMDNARELGFKPRMQFISTTMESITEPAMEALDAPNELMLCVRKVIFADALPIMYDSAYVSTAMPDSIVAEFSERFVIDALERQGIQATITRMLIDAAPASGPAVQALGIPSGFPMLRRLYRYDTTRPGFEIFGIVESPFDRLACSITLRPPFKKSRK